MYTCMYTTYISVLINIVKLFHFFMPYSLFHPLGVGVFSVCFWLFWFCGPFKNVVVGFCFDFVNLFVLLMEPPLKDTTVIQFVHTGPFCSFHFLHPHPTVFKIFK